jgi:hypothetical protein
MKFGSKIDYECTFTLCKKVYIIHTVLRRIVFNSVQNILMYIQQDATLNSLFYLEAALHVSSNIITHH